MDTIMVSLLKVQRTNQERDWSKESTESIFDGWYSIIEHNFRNRGDNNFIGMLVIQKG